MRFGTPYTTVHLNITIEIHISENRIALGVHINLGVHLCVWCTTKVNVKIELWSGLIQHKFLLFM